MNEDKDRDFVRKMLHAYTWWKLKQKLDEALLGKKHTHKIEAAWKKNTDA